MALVVHYAVNLGYDSTLASEKKWIASVLFKPSTVASGETAPTATDGPLSTTGKANASYTHGDGTATGFASPLDALQKALTLISDCIAHNPTALP